MKNYLLPLLSLLVLGMILVACGGSSDIPVAPDAKVLFKDDFSNTEGGWDQVQDEGEAVIGYVNQAYQMKVIKANSDFWAKPEGQSFSDVRVEVKATKITGSTDNNDFGVICRYKNPSNFYYFIISSDGYYGIQKMKNGSLQWIDMDEMVPSDVINLGDAENQIRADCVGNELTLYINGQKIIKVTDSTFSEGNVGLIAGTFDEGYTEILFDDFKVLKP